MAFLGSALSCILTALLGAAAVLLALRFLVSMAPVARLSGLRRRLFLLTEPLLEPFLPWLETGGEGADWTALLGAAACLILLKIAGPWVLWAGFRLSGG